ncbi:HTH-type transcriptional regulator AdhR [Thermacetogenium phaeum DSM 12270]|uniref:HTH-type transcriptional regulator AdhR n=1 Tax=Thermacetogenium phaeum (strain ATCC BAA-254 / DSM 26808 / PB) TaxID=1089553 RepID=K4LJY7_THEPS|nr:MerR family transcriptional regulator [Thermacetogenium phaeum]AFV12362.1 HTH-type transcriptional regulator AdhR [Thermacetogenium phaeum DSM 12270]
MTIAEVSKRFGLSPDTLRYYERIGLIPRVSRNESGIRNYTEEDCKWIEFIKCMRSAGVQVETLVEYVTLLQQGDKTIEARKQILIEQREKLFSRIEEMERALERLNFKIKEYETKLIPAENKLKRLATTSTL